MTSFAAVFKVTTQNRLRLLNKLLLINLMVIVISFLLTLFSQRIRPYWSLSLFFNILFWIAVFEIVVLVAIIVSSRNCLRSNRFRLIPISDIKLYLADLSSSVIGVVYASFCQWVAVILSIIILWLGFPHNKAGADFRSGFWLGFKKGSAYSGGLSSTLLSILAMILIILLVHLVDFLSTTLLNYVPGGAQKMVKLVVYVVVIMLVVYVIFNIIRILYSLYQGNFLKQAPSFWMTDGLMVIFIVIIGSINLGLLPKVETTR